MDAPERGGGECPDAAFPLYCRGLISDLSIDDESDQMHPITLVMAKRIIAETLREDDQSVDAKILQEALRANRRSYLDHVSAVEFVNKNHIRLVSFIEKLQSASDEISELLQVQDTQFIDQLALSLSIPRLPSHREHLSFEEDNYRFNGAPVRVQAKEYLLGWQTNSDTLLEITQSIYRLGLCAKSAIPKRASKLALRPSIVPKSNRLGDGPAVKLIAYGLYVTYQLVFGRRISWSTETSTGPAVRFAIKALEELKIPHPIPDQVFTPTQIVSIWDRHSGRSAGQGMTKSRQRSARRSKGG